MTAVLDTTPARDTFLGHFISHIYEKIFYKESFINLSKAASVTVSRHGASNSIPYLSELDIPKL